MNNGKRYERISTLSGEGHEVVAALQAAGFDAEFLGEVPAPWTDRRTARTTHFDLDDIEVSWVPQGNESNTTELPSRIHAVLVQHESDKRAERHACYMEWYQSLQK